MLERIIAGIIFHISTPLLTFFFASSVILSGILPNYPRNARYRRGHFLASLWGKSLFGMIPGWRLEIDGTENLPAEGDPVVLVANHESLVDILAMYSLDTQFCWLSKESIMKVPVLGQAMYVCGCVPIKRGDKHSHEEALRKSAERLKQGLNMFFFPEGTRSEVPGVMRPFKMGAFKLADENGVDILPVALSGAGKLFRKNGKLPEPATVKLRVLPRTKRASDETYEAYAARVRSTIESALRDMA
jgi:1-acyl-sn-glycerol-3-phosphate acyltransferase